MSQFEQQRAAVPGRRQADEECLVHEQRLDDMDSEIHKQSGWLKACGGFFGIVVLIGVPLIGWIGTSILGKLTSIETLLSDNKVVVMKHTMQIESLERRVGIIEDRHINEDQRKR